MKARFYLCKQCGNVIVKLVDSGVTPVCCSESMVELKANENDGAREKHLPVYTTAADGTLTVTVGSALHPMLPEHWIEFIYVQTEKGGQISYLKPGCEPTAKFLLTPGDKVTAIYAYCNIHGLWVTKKCGD